MAYEEINLTITEEPVELTVEESIGIVIEYPAEIGPVGPKGEQGDEGPEGPEGPQGEQGDSLEYDWDGTKLGVRVEGDASYEYTDLEGPQGEIGIDWQGDWSSGTYEEGQAVHHVGSAWYANKETSEEPSGSASDWDLIAEKGEDGEGSGDVDGPDSSTTDNIAVFADSSGKEIKDGGKAVSDFLEDITGESIRDLSDVQDTGPSDGDVLVWNDAESRYEPGEAGTSSPLTTKGDLWAYDGDDTRLPVGTDDYVLTADSSTSTGLAWKAGGGGASGDKIEEGDSSVEVIDSGDGEIVVNVDGNEQLLITDGEKKFDLPIWTFPEGVYVNDDLLIFFTDGDGGVNRSTLVGYGAMGSYNASESEYNYDAVDTWQTLCFGQNAGQRVATGQNNCLIGVQAGANVIGSDENCFLGTRAGFIATKDAGDGNVGIGYYCGYMFETAKENVWIGKRAGFGEGSGDRSSGEYNVCIGAYAGAGGVNANGNILIGHSVGENLTDYDDKLYIENSADVANPLIYGEMGEDADNRLCIGCSITRTTGRGLTIRGECVPETDDEWTLGNNDYRWDAVYAQSGTIQTSDGKCKEKIEDSNLGLDFILNIKPKSYVLKDRVVEEYYEEEEEIDKQECFFLPLDTDLKSILDKDEQYEIVEKDGVKQYRIFRDVKKKIRHPRTRTKTIKHRRKHHGMIAQDVEKLLEEKGIDTNDFAGFIKDKETGRYSLRYDEFIAPLIKSVQELKAENDELKKEVQDLKDRLSKIEDMLQEEDKK